MHRKDVQEYTSSMPNVPSNTIKYNSMLLENKLFYFRLSTVSYTIILFYNYATEMFITHSRIYERKKKKKEEKSRSLNIQRIKFCEEDSDDS